MFAAVEEILIVVLSVIQGEVLAGKVVVVRMDTEQKYKE